MTHWKGLALAALLAVAQALPVAAQRSETVLRHWKFHRGEAPGAAAEQFNDSKWTTVSVPHDWAITGPFDRNNDLQTVMVVQDLEKKAGLKTGRTGGLPYMGVGWYRNTFSVPQGRRAMLVLEGAMNEPTIYINGRQVAFFPNGYQTNAVDVTPYVHADGSVNTVSVRLKNRAHSSRWYPGAGLFRPVRLVLTGQAHIPLWGQYVTTPYVSQETATVAVVTPIANCSADTVVLIQRLQEKGGAVVGTYRQQYALRAASDTLRSHLQVDAPHLWSPEHPNLYTLTTLLRDREGTLLDSLQTEIGIRSIAFVPEKGFFLNGQHRQIQGVCVHHDLGALGTAVNAAAISHRLKLLKDMGCDAVRTSHNIPSPELVRQCDSLGLMMLVEPFDEWDKAKCDSGYHTYFNEWAEHDVAQMVRHFRNHPSIVLWGIGNEVPNQRDADGWRTVQRLQDVCHREDPTRPVTVCMDQIPYVLKNGFARDVDVPGINYNTWNYAKADSVWNKGFVLGSETASTVSSRGVYKFPVALGKGVQHADHQSSAYDVEVCPWSNTPDVDFFLAEQSDKYLGQFVWTGFDYLGEPTPYNNDSWPSHSSLFGIIDLANLPKDRFYLYRSQWRHDDHTLHVLPSWTHPGMEGKTVPVFAYTDAPEAELFVNGKSQGRRRKLSTQEYLDTKAAGGDSLALLRHYRLIWDSVKYEPGEIEVVAYDSRGNELMRQKHITAGEPFALQLSADRTLLKSGQDDLAFVTVTVVDRKGNPCPNASNLVSFKVTGAGTFKGAANGDATDVHPFQSGKMAAFSGQLQAIVQAGEKAGTITLEATAKGLKKAILKLNVADLKGAPASQPAKHITIMGLGDSITEGGENFSSYVFPLWELLQENGFTNCEFIGPRQQQCRVGTIQHCGFSGKNVEFLDSQIDSIYRRHPADIVLLHAGHNHFANEQPVAGMLKAYRSIIAKLQRINPNVTVVIAKVITSGKLPKYSYIPQLNKEIEKLVKEYHSPHIRLVDQSRGWDWQRHTVQDKVHPTQAGARKMAEVWLDELKKILPQDHKKALVDTLIYKKGVSGRDLSLRIYRPEQRQGKRPAVVYLFAGGWKNGTPLQFERECAKDVRHGRIAIAVDYSIASLDHSTPKQAYDDVVDAYGWILRHADSLGIDRSRIVLAGASAGATMAAAMCLDERHDVSPCGLMLFYPVVDKIKGFLAASSDAHRHLPPFTFLIGDHDNFTPLQRAQAFVEEQRRCGADAELHVFNGRPHPIFYYRKQQDCTFDRYLQLSEQFLQRMGL